MRRRGKTSNGAGINFYFCVRREMRTGEKNSQIVLELDFIILSKLVKCITAEKHQKVLVF